MNQITQALVSAAASIIVVAVLALWRRLHKTLGEARKAMTSIQDFTAAWTSAAALETVIRADSASQEASVAALTAIANQLGTERRPAEWPALEEYVHEMRHEARNNAAAFKVLADLLGKVVGQLNLLIDRSPERNPST